MRAGGQTDFLKALGNYATRATSPGVCVVVSDFMEPQWERGVRALLARKFQIILVQVLDPLEAEPDIMGDLRLCDMETGETRDVSVTPAVIARYKEAFETFCASISESAKRHGMEYIQVRTDAPVETLLLKTLRTSGYLQ
jgi:sirohydrochlorin ferrochelatase